MIQFDEHIFQKGWNHQLDLCWILTRIIPSTAKPRCRFFLASNSVPKSHMLEGNRMLKMNMEPNHGGLVQIIFLSIHGWFVGSSRSSSKVYVFLVLGPNHRRSKLLGWDFMRFLDAARSPEGFLFLRICAVVEVACWHPKKTGWWFQLCFKCSSRSLGKIPILTMIFQMGWNDQLENQSERKWVNFELYFPAW